MLTALQNLLTRLPVLRDFKNLYIIVLGLILVLTISFLPRGIAGAWRSLRRRRPPPVPPRLEPALAAPVAEQAAVGDIHSEKV